MLRPYEKRVASTGGHPSRGDREFAPSDTQEFSLPLQKAGEFKGLLPVPPGPGDDGDAEAVGFPLCVGGAVCVVATSLGISAVSSRPPFATVKRLVDWS